MDGITTAALTTRATTRKSVENGAPVPAGAPPPTFFHPQHSTKRVLLPEQRVEPSCNTTTYALSQLRWTTHSLQRSIQNAAVAPPTVTPPTVRRQPRPLCSPQSRTLRYSMKRSGIVWPCALRRTPSSSTRLARIRSRKSLSSSPVASSTRLSAF